MGPGAGIVSGRLEEFVVDHENRSGHILRSCWLACRTKG